MNKSGRVFSALPTDQTHEQLNAVVKHDGGVIVLTDNDTTLGRYVVSGPAVARLIADFESNLFSCVRSKNPLPSPLELKNSLHLLTVSQYLKGSEHGSYDITNVTTATSFVQLELLGCICTSIKNSERKSSSVPFRIKEQFAPRDLNMAAMILTEDL